jgi:hypothetical protein
VNDEWPLRIRIRWPKGSVVAALDRTPTAERLIAVLPVDAIADTWGEEVYFGVPVAAPLEPGAREIVVPGTVCYWPPGNALALPFGPTPISCGDECRLASPCNVLGRIEGDASVLKSVRVGDTIRVEPETVRRT